MAIFGVLVGLVNGAVITRFGVAPFICTLGAGVRRPRLRCCLTTGAPTRISTAWKRWAAPVSPPSAPAPCSASICRSISMIGFLVLGYWLTTKTPLGRYIYAIGGNESAARLAGVPIVKAKIFVYAFSGLCAAFVG